MASSDCFSTQRVSQFAAQQGAINSFIADGLFAGQPKNFLDLLLDVAKNADAAQRLIL
ncbi:MAG TPA: hypothetical protein VKV17_20850 [Bryobacteraceae bacterium]|nr:hypothetical protein [Bryobacteraceae bacterium]